VSLVAGGTCAAGSTTQDNTQLDVQATIDDPDWGIVQAPFMRDNAKTISFQHHIGVQGDVLSYDETMVLEIYGKRFDHTDRNELHRA
jgi:hypothetical protein